MLYILYIFIYILYNLYNGAQDRTAKGGREGKSGDHFYCFLLLSTHIRDEYHIFLIPSFVSTNLLHEKYHSFVLFLSELQSCS